LEALRDIDHKGSEGEAGEEGIPMFINIKTSALKS
jgi:hypothetical protein